MPKTPDHLVSKLSELVGLPLTIARRAGNMAMLHFGKIRRIKGGSVGIFSLHIQCAWRVENRNRIVLGNLDLYEPPSYDEKWFPDDWRYDTHPSLFDKLILDLLGAYDKSTKSAINTESKLIVHKVSLNKYGDLTIWLSGGYVLRVLVNSSLGEQWRFLPPGNKATHLVWEDGTLTT